MESLTSIAVIYRMQGWFEIRDPSDPVSPAQLETLLSWAEAVPPKWLGPPLAYVRGKLYIAHHTKLPPAQLTSLMQTTADYLDTIFEHYATAAYPGDARLLQSATLAAKHIQLKPIVAKLTPLQFCFRSQGYLELANTQTLTNQQAATILGWLERLSTKQSQLLTLKEPLRLASEGCGAILARELQDYFIRYIDPTFPGDAKTLHQIHKGENNPLGFAPAG